MKFKKLATGIVIGAMAFSLAAPAAALGGSTSSGSTSGGSTSGGSTSGGSSSSSSGGSSLTRNTNVGSTVTVPKIDVDIPTTTSIVLNPYKLTIQDAEGDDTTAQVVTAPSFIANNSDLDIGISVKFKGTLKGTGMSFATSSLAGSSSTDKEIFLQMNLGAATDGETESASYTTWAIDETENEQEDVLTLNAASDGEATYASFKITGDMVQNPEAMWTANDTVSVAIAWTLTPNSSVA